MTDPGLTRASRISPRREDGQVAGVEAIAFGMLVLVIGILIVSNAWGVIDAKTAAREAAREAARSFATAPPGADDQVDGLARQAALDTLHELGWNTDGVTVRRIEGAFVRCAVVTYQVSIPVPAFRLPWIRSTFSAFRATATHTEQVDPYRSGIPGDTTTGAADCAVAGGP